MNRTTEALHCQRYCRIFCVWKMSRYARQYLLETSWNRLRLQTSDIKVKIFHSINGDRRCRGGLTRGFRIARGRVLAGRMRYARREFHSRRGVAAVLQTSDPLQILKNGSHLLFPTVINARKILLALACLSLPPAVLDRAISPCLSVFPQPVYQKTRADSRNALIEIRKI